MSRDQKIEIVKLAAPFVVLGIWAVAQMRLDNVYLRTERYEREQHQLAEQLTRESARDQQWRQRVEDKIDNIQTLMYQRKP